MKHKYFKVFVLLMICFSAYKINVVAFSNFNYAYWKNSGTSTVNLAMKPSSSFNKVSGWNEILSNFQQTSNWQTYGNTLGMREQYYCHADYKLLLDIAQEEWNLEPWRMVVNNDWILYFHWKCNPPRHQSGCVIGPDGITIICPNSEPLEIEYE